MSTSPTAAARVYEIVKELVLSSEIPGGALISENEIATRCGVSRTPVREAFLKLEAEGWMCLYPKRGALVLPVSDREAADVVEARILLECHAVEQIVGHPAVRDGLIDRLQANIVEHRSVDPADLAAFARVDAQFHQLIVGAGDNPLLADFFAGLGERHRRMTTASVHRDPTVTEHIVDDHCALVAAITAGDPHAFAAALTEHLESVHRLAPRSARKAALR